MARDRDDRDDREEEKDERPRRRPRDDDEYEDRRPPQTTNPGGAKAAGIIWIITGSLAAILTLVGIFLMLSATARGGPPAQFICGIVFWGFIALVFLMVGIKTVTASSGEPLANGIGSIIFGLLIGGLGAWLLIGGVDAMLQGGALGGAIGSALTVVAGALIAYGAMLLLAGILIIVARDNYVRYRKYKKAQRRAADDRGRGRRRERDDDEEEERPRRKRPRDNDED